MPDNPSAWRLTVARRRLADTGRALAIAAGLSIDPGECRYLLAKRAALPS